MPDEITRYYTRYLSQVTGPYPRSTISRMAQSRRLTRGHEVSSDRQNWIPLEDFLVQDVSGRKNIPQTAPGHAYQATYRMRKTQDPIASQSNQHGKRSGDNGGFHVSPTAWLVGGGLLLLTIGALVLLMSSDGSNHNASRGRQRRNMRLSSVPVAPAAASPAIKFVHGEASSVKTVQSGGGINRGKATSPFTRSVVVGHIGTPIWLKLVRRGNTVTASYSENGKRWTQLGAPEHIAFGHAAILAGMAVCAHNNTLLNTSRFSHVAIVRSQSSWADSNIGYPGKLGSAQKSNGIWTVTGGGSDVWGRHDQFNLFSRTVRGNTVITARVDSQTNTDAWAKSGVMLRGSVDSSSPYAYIFVTPHIGLAFQWRPHHSTP